MTEEEMVAAGAKAIVEMRGCYGRQTGAVCADPMDDNCDCGKIARAVLAAVEPKIRADERERAAKIAEDRNAGLDQPDGGAPTPREMCLNIAATIRDDKKE